VWFGRCASSWHSHRCWWTLYTLVHACSFCIKNKESSPAGVKVSNMDRLLKRPQANFNILVDISILAAAAHLLLAENEQSTSACVGLSSLSRPDSHSSASINGAHPVPCSRQLVSNCDASNTSSTAHAPLLSTAHLWEEKERIQQAPKSQIIEAALQILA